MLYALADAHRTRWTHSDELLALILEKLDALLIQTVALWAKDPPRNQKPYRYPRPKAERRERPSTHAEIVAFFRR